MKLRLKKGVGSDIIRKIAETIKNVEKFNARGEQSECGRL
ncbi:MAG: hypothetical protein DBX58_08140 [Clostridiales bacterium]|nr:MAG: hypothetical protein DBX58_08140 [Clostridiales bacterium]